MVQEAPLVEKQNYRSPSVIRPLSPINETFLSKRKATINIQAKSSLEPAHLKKKESPNNNSHEMGGKMLTNKKYHIGAIHFDPSYQRRRNRGQITSTGHIGTEMGSKYSLPDCER